MINLKTHTCCGRKPVRRQPKKNYCCGFVAYDRKKFVCCNDRSIVKRQIGKTRCCGNQLINPKKSSCCSGEIFKKVKGKNYVKAFLNKN